MTNPTATILDHSGKFVVFRRPGEKDFYLFEQLFDSNKKPVSDLEKQTGFAFHPFEKDGVYPSIFLHADRISANPNILFTPPSGTLLASTSKSEYLRQAELFISALGSDLKKLVLSRVLNLPNDRQDIFVLFKKLCQAYPTAFVYLINHPDAGCWMGATPEILLECEHNKCVTMSLAGTMVFDPLNPNESWGKKDLEEQAIVSAYIEDILNRNGIGYLKTGPVNHRAGNLVHLKTLFEFSRPKEFWKLIHQLHPTPAVCGLPKQAAQEFILRHENHRRTYYTGFLGPVNFQDKNSLFVNLRCMQLTKEEFVLYLGGGIIPASFPDNEWEETVNKSQTLLSVF